MLHLLRLFFCVKEKKENFLHATRPSIFFKYFFSKWYASSLPFFCRNSRSVHAFSAINTTKEEGRRRRGKMCLHLFLFPPNFVASLLTEASSPRFPRKKNREKKYTNALIVFNSLRGGGKGKQESLSPSHSFPSKKSSRH